MSSGSTRIWGPALVVVCLCLGSACKSGPTARDYLGDAREAIEESRYDQASTFLDLAREKGASEGEIRTARAQLHRGRALRLLEAGESRRAFEAFVRAGDLDPRAKSSSQTYLRALEIGERVGLAPEKLAQVAQNATEANPESTRARRATGKYWEAAGKPKRALRPYLWLWQSERSPVDIGRRLAAVYRKLGRPEDAIAVLHQLLEKTPSDAQAALSLAGLYAEVDQTGRARRMYEKLVAEHPEKPSILLRYARFLETQGETGEARRLKRRAYEEMPGRDPREMRELE